MNGMQIAHSHAVPWLLQCQFRLDWDLERVSYVCSFLLFHFSRYWVFRSWGRVGTVIGSNKLEQMPSKDDAVEHFLNLYEEKTGNSWHSKNFTKYPKKFYPLEIDYGQVTLKWPCTRWSIAQLLCYSSSVQCSPLDHLHLTNPMNEVQVPSSLCYREPALDQWALSVKIDVLGN